MYFMVSCWRLDCEEEDDAETTVIGASYIGPWKREGWCRSRDPQGQWNRFSLSDGPMVEDRFSLFTF